MSSVLYKSTSSGSSPGSSPELAESWRMVSPTWTSPDVKTDNNNASKNLSSVNLCSQNNNAASNNISNAVANSTNCANTLRSSTANSQMMNKDNQGSQKIPLFAIHKPRDEGRGEMLRRMLFNSPPKTPTLRADSTKAINANGDDNDDRGGADGLFAHLINNSKAVGNTNGSNFNALRNIFDASPTNQPEDEPSHNSLMAGSAELQKINYNSKSFPMLLMKSRIDSSSDLNGSSDFITTEDSIELPDEGICSDDNFDGNQDRKNTLDLERYRDGFQHLLLRSRSEDASSSMLAKLATDADYRNSAYPKLLQKKKREVLEESILACVKEMRKERDSFENDNNDSLIRTKSEPTSELSQYSNISDGLTALKENQRILETSVTDDFFVRKGFARGRKRRKDIRDDGVDNKSSSKSLERKKTRSIRSHRSKSLNYRESIDSAGNVVVKSCANSRTRKSPRLQRGRISYHGEHTTLARYPPVGGFTNVPCVAKGIKCSPSNGEAAVNQAAVNHEEYLHLAANEQEMDTKVNMIVNSNSSSKIEDEIDNTVTIEQTTLTHTQTTSIIRVVRSYENVTIPHTSSGSSGADSLFRPLRRTSTNKTNNTNSSFQMLSSSSRDAISSNTTTLDHDSARKLSGQILLFGSPLPSSELLFRPNAEDDQYSSTNGQNVTAQTIMTTTTTTTTTRKVNVNSFDQYARLGVLPVLKNSNASSILAQTHHEQFYASKASYLFHNSTLLAAKTQSFFREKLYARVKARTKLLPIMLMSTVVFLKNLHPEMWWRDALNFSVDAASNFYNNVDWNAVVENILMSVGDISQMSLGDFVNNSNDLSPTGASNLNIDLSLFKSNAALIGQRWAYSTHGASNLLKSKLLTEIAGSTTAALPVAAAAPASAASLIPPQAKDFLNEFMSELGNQFYDLVKVSALQNFKLRMVQ